MEKGILPFGPHSTPPPSKVASSVCSVIAGQTSGGGRGGGGGGGGEGEGMDARHDESQPEWQKGRTSAENNCFRPD